MSVFRKTKIIATIGPACNTKEKIKSLVLAGMNVARLNFSHASHDQHKQAIQYLKEVREELGISLAILQDTQGPEIRIGKVPEEGLKVQPGSRFRLVKDPKNADELSIAITPPQIIDQLSPDDTVLIDDGYIETSVVTNEGDSVVLEVHNFGVIKERKGVNLPGKTLNFPDITEKDIADIKFGCEQDIDIIAASFICHPSQVIAIKKLLVQEGAGDIQVLAKIESQQGVDNFDQILDVSDGIMVARGDLGVEMPITSIPRIQKNIIKKCGEQAKPVIIATQMLESMIHCPRPTRAEVSDVANAIYDSASAVMLSAETATGSYAISTVKMMDAIVRDAEADVDIYGRFHRKLKETKFCNVPDALAQAAVSTCVSANAAAIVVFSKSGNTARLLSCRRARIPLIVMTPKKKTYHQMALAWGAHAVLERIQDIKANLDFLSCYAIQQGLVQYGDTVIVTLGTPYGISYTTNTITVETVGSVVAKGVPAREEATDEFVYGKRTFFYEGEPTKKLSFDNVIVVLTEFKEEYAPMLTGAIGIILQNRLEDIASENRAAEFSKKHNIPCILRAYSAASLLEADEWISIQESRGLIFRGDAEKEKDMIEKTCIDSSNLQIHFNL